MDKTKPQETAQPALTTYGEDMVMVDGMIRALKERNVDNDHLMRLAAECDPEGVKIIGEQRKQIDDLDNKVENLEQENETLAHESALKHIALEEAKDRLADDAEVTKEFDALEEDRDELLDLLHDVGKLLFRLSRFTPTDTADSIEHPQRIARMIGRSLLMQAGKLDVVMIEQGKTIDSHPGYFAQREWKHLRSLFNASMSCKRWLDECLSKQEKNGVDVHNVTAAVFHDVPLDEVTKEQREDGKTLNFRIAYGGEVPDGNVDILPINMEKYTCECGTIVERRVEAGPKLCLECEDE